MPKSRSRQPFPKRFLIAFSLIVVVAGAMAAYAAGQDAAVIDPAPSPSASVAPSPSPVVATAAKQPATTASQPTGTITGKRIFPAEGLPADFTTCAVNMANGQATCIAGNEDTYSLTVAPGKYQVYAMVPSFRSDYKAYYDQFIVCGIKAECTDHTPITITVPAGGTRSGVDVGDFYLE